MTSTRTFHTSLTGVAVRRAVAGLVAGVLVAALDGRVIAGALTVISPSGASPGVTVQVTGSGFNATAANNEVTFEAASGERATATPTGATLIDASRDLRRLTVRVPGGIPVGAAAVTVRNTVTNETSGGISIDIVGLSLPEVSSGAVGAANLKVRILGTANARFVSGARAIFGAGVTVHSTTVESSTSVVATISVAAAAALGARTVTVTTTTQTVSLVDGFTVLAVPPPDPNAAPTVSAGPGSAIGSGETATLSGTATDDGLPAGSTLQLTWTKQSGPGAVTFADATAASTTATFGKNGTYVLRLTGTDGDKTAFSELTVTVAANKGPVVTAQSDLAEVIRPNGVTLTGSATDDGLPTGSTLVIKWTKRKGPGNVTFSSPSTTNSTATFSKEGSYVLRLSASDGKLTGVADVEVAVRANTAPSVDVGADQAVTLPNAVALNGDVTDDGLPPGSTVTFTWTRTAGPSGGVVTFANPNAASTTATFSKVGNYTLRLTASDGEKSAFDALVVTVSAAPVNVAPTVSAGQDQGITLPAEASLQGSVNDDGLPNGAAVTATWTKQSGPGTVTFASASAPVTTASFSEPGQYVLRLTASDTALSAFDEVTVDVDPAPVPNVAPTVGAGADLTITLPETASLNGAVNDDGLPAGAQVSLQWTKQSGPGNVVFSAATAAATTASFSESGAYVLRLTASDTELSAFDEVAVLVNPTPPENVAPTANAGDNQTVTLPAAAALAGTATDDGLPAGAVLVYSWSKQSGPGTVTFGAADAASTTATFSEPGEYVLRLTVNDTDKSAFDEVTVDVNPPTPVNTAPVVNAGNDLSIVLPLAAKLGGVVTDDGRPTASVKVAWRKIEGDGEVIFTPPDAAASSAAFSAPGKYLLELRGDDGELSAVDTVLVTVAAPTATNTAPSVNAGSDQEVPIEFGAQLAGEATDDGQPGPALLLSWTKVSGPGLVVFGAPSAAQTTATFDQPGVYVLSLTASDGELSTTDDLAVAVAARAVFGDVTPPIVRLSAPKEALPGAVIELRATATDDVAVTSVAFDVNGGAPQDAPQQPYAQTFTVPELAEPGSVLTVRVVARDAAGNAAEDTAVVAISVTPDTESPTLSLFGPSGSPAGRAIRLIALAQDNVGVDRVTFLVGDQEISTDPESPYEASYLIPGDTLAGPPFVVTARARDAAGNLAEATWSIVIRAANEADTTPPQIELTVPDQVVAGSELPIAATATDASGIAGVSFRIGENLLLGTDAEAPYATTYAVPALTAPGAVLQVVAEATDFAGLTQSATRSVTVLSSDGAVAAVTGEVYDDTTSLPLAGASIALTGVDASGAAYTQTTMSDARGRYLLRASPGQGVLRIHKQGWTRVDRPVALVGGQALETLDARLTPFRGAAQTITSITGGTLGAEVRALLPAGALAQPEALNLVRVSQQGIQGRLPYGWSPVGGADIAPHGIQFAAAATLRAPNALAVDAAATVLLAQWDEVASAWRMRGAARRVAGEFEAAIHGTGHYQFVVPDAAPVAPVVPVAGALLSGVDAPVLPAGLDTEIAPQPQVLFYKPGVFSDVRGRISAASPMTSGALLLARLTESYTFYSGADARPEPFLEDLIGYQAGGPPSSLSATAIVTPSLTFDPLALERGVIAVELFAPGAVAPIGLVGAGGGAVDGPAGLRLLVPAGALSDSSPIVLGTLDGSDLGPLPAGLTLVHGVQVTLAEALARGANLSVPKPAAITGGERLLLVQFQAIKGETRPVLVGVVRLEGDRLVSDTIVANQQTALQGVKSAGPYAFVQADSALGFAGGVVRGVNAQPFPGALVTAAGFPVVSLSNLAGGYLAAAPTGGVTLTATDLVKSDVGTAASFFSEGVLLPVSLQLVAQPPRVTELSPANGETNVPLSGVVRVTFSEAIDPASVAGANLANILLADAGGNRLEGTASLSQANTVLTFRPTTPLDPNSQYRITIGTGIQDTSGYALSAEVQASFQSLDTDPPPPPAAGALSASIPNAQGLVTVSATQGTAGPNDRVFVDNLTKKTVAVALVDPNGSFSTVIAAGLTDKLRVRIVDAAGNETIEPLGVFKQTNADGSVSQAVGAEGGVVEGPGGLRATIKPGTFPAGAAVTLNTVTNEEIPITFTPEQSEVFEKQGGFSIDFGGATPQQYIDISLPAGPNDSEADQWVVAEVVDLGTETVFNVSDTAKFFDGRIATASPPCPGVTAAGVYGLTKAKQTYGLNYAEMYANGRYGLKAAWDFTLANLGPVPTPFTALSAVLPTPVCFPVITGRVTIVPNTVRVKVDGTLLTPTDREIVITNTTRPGGVPVSYPRTAPDFVFDNPWPNDGLPLAGAQYRATMIKGDARQRVPIGVQTLQGVPKLVVRSAFVAIPATSIEIVDITRLRSATVPVEAQHFEVSVNGGVTDTFEVVAVPRPALLLDTTEVPAPYLDRRPVAHQKLASPFGDGNLVLKALPGTIDPTREEMNAAGISGPARTHTYLANQHGLLPIPNEKIVQGGIAGFAFTGDPQADYTYTIVYDSRPNFLVKIPRTRFVVTNTLTGDVVRDEWVPSPPRDEPVAIAPIIDDSVDPVVISGPARVDNFDPTSLLTFRFSESMDAQSLKDNFVVLDSDGRQVGGDVRVSELNRTATFVPSGGLKLGAEYTVLLRGRVGDAEDTGGNDLIRDVAGRPIQQVRLNVRTFRPRPISSFASADPFKDIAIRRKRQGPENDLRTSLFITTGGSANNLASLDVTDPFKPVRIGGDTSLPSRQRVALIPDARFTFGGPQRPSQFSGDFAITTAFNVSRSFVTFLDVTDATRPTTISTKVLTRVPEDFVQALPVVWENAYAKGITAVQAGDEVYAYAAVERVGLMFIDVGNNMPQSKLETVYPGDITDVVAHRDVLFALDKTRGQPQLLALGLSFEELAPATPLTSTPRRIRIGERLLADLNGDGQVLTEEHVDVAVVGTDRDLQVFNIGDRSGRVGDAQDPKPMELVARIPLKGTVRDVEVDASRLRAILIVDEPIGPQLTVVDLARLDGAQSTLELIDQDSDGHDDRVVFRHGFPAGVNGMRLDFERGLLYVGTPAGLEIWQVFDNCCDLAVDMTTKLKIRPSGRSNDVFKKELMAIKKGIVAGLKRAEVKCDGFDVTQMRIIESGSSACLWTADPEKSCGNNYQPGLSDHDFSTFMPDAWYTAMVDNPDVPEDHTGPVPQIPLAACVARALTFPFTDPHTEEPKDVENTGFYFHDLSFLPNWTVDFFSSNYRLDRTIPGVGGDEDNDLGMGRQLQAMKHLTEAYGVDLAGTPGVQQSYLSINVTETQFEQLFKQFRTITKVPHVEGYEWAVLMEFALAKGKAYLRIAGSADEASSFHKLNVKQLHGGGKAGIRAAIARMVSMPASRDLLLGVRRGPRPQQEPADPNDTAPGGGDLLIFRKDACLVFRGDTDPAEPAPPPFAPGVYAVHWDAKPCGSLEEYAASTAVRTLTLPPAEQPFTLAEVKDIIRFYRVKGDLEPITTDFEADGFMSSVIRFVRKVKADTYPIYQALVEAPDATDPKRVDRRANRDWAEGAADPQTGRRDGGRIKKFLTEAKLPIVPHVYNRSFRNAPAVKLRMHHAAPGTNAATPYCGPANGPLPDCAFQLDLAGGESVFAAWRRKADGTLLLDDESLLAVPIFKIDLDFIEMQKKRGHVAFTIDLQERSTKEAFRENNLGGFYYYILGLDGFLEQGPPAPVLAQVPSPFPQAAFEPDPECVLAPSLILTQYMTVDDDPNLPAARERLSSPVLLYQGQKATLEIQVKNPTPNQVTDATVCTTLASPDFVGPQQACRTGISVGPNATVPVSFPFSSSKPVVLESVATATSPDIGIATSSPFSLSVNCEPLIVFYDPNPNQLGPGFSVMRGGRAVRYARALNPFTGRPAINTTVLIQVTGSDVLQSFGALRNEPAGEFRGGGLGTPNLAGNLVGDYSKDYEGMAFRVPEDFAFGEHRARIVKVNGADIACGAPIDLDFKVRSLEYTQSMSIGAAAKFGLAVELGLTGSVQGGLKFAFGVKRDNVPPPGTDPLVRITQDLQNIKSLDYEPTGGIGLKVSVGTSAAEFKAGVKDVIEAKAELATAEGSAEFESTSGHRFRFGGYSAFRADPPNGEDFNAETKDLASLVVFSLFNKGAYQIEKLKSWIPALERPFAAVLAQVARFEPRRTHTLATYGVKLEGAAKLLKATADVLPAPKPPAGDGEPGGGGGQGGGGQGGGGEEPKKESGKAVLNLEANAGATASASAALEQTERLRLASGDEPAPLDKETWFHLDFSYAWKTEFSAALPRWRQSLDAVDLGEGDELNDAVKERGKEELGKIEKWIQNGLEKVCAPNCNIDLSGNVSFGVKSELETVNGVPSWVVKKVMVRFRSPKQFEGLPAGSPNEGKGEYRLTYALDAKRYEPGSEEFKKLLARLYVKLKALAFALTEEQRKRADELIAAVGLASHGDFQPLVNVATRPPEPINGARLANDFMGALRIIIANGDVSEEMTKRTEKGLTVGGKIKVFGVGGEIEFTPIKFTREVEYQKAVGRLLEGKLFMLEDYTDISLNPFDPQEYITNTIQTYVTELFTEVLRKLKEDAVEFVEGVKKGVGTATAKLVQNVDEGVKLLPWPFGRTEPLPNVAPEPYRPLHDRARAGRAHYGIGGFLMFDNEAGILQNGGELVITYDDEELEGAPEGDVRLYRWNPDRQDWDERPAAMNAAANTVTAQITDLGLYTLGVLMPAGDLTWTVLSKSVTGQGADTITTVELESSVLSRNDGNPAPPGALVHVRVVAHRDLDDFTADPIGTVVTTDADTVIPGVQVATGATGRVRVVVSLPGTHATLYLQAFTDVGTADGTAAIVLPQP